MKREQFAVALRKQKKQQILSDKRQKFERTKLMKIATDPTFKIVTSEHLRAVLEHLSSLVIDKDQRIFGHLN